MVLIISRPNDQSTANVIDWLYYLKKPFRRINGSEIFCPDSRLSLHLNPEECSFSLDETKTDTHCGIDAVWFRRDDTHQLSSTHFSQLTGESVHPEMIEHINRENAIGKQAFYASLTSTAKTKTLGHHTANKVNKFAMLLLAKKHGLTIPHTLITNHKADLRRFSGQHPSIITKNMGNSLAIAADTAEPETLQLYTEELTAEYIDALPDTFAHSLFQEKLEKEVDIRSFYLNGSLYSMAIFSQADGQTKVDFRKYARNRNVPYKLPPDTENSLNALMQEAGLNTGSIDMVKTADGRLVFLEVNPVGQYDMTTVSCNYQLDKKIAEFLAN